MSTVICYGGGNRKKMVLNTVFRRRNNATVGLGSVLFEFCFDSAHGIAAGFQNRTVEFHPLTNALSDTLCLRWKNVNSVSIKHYSAAVIFTTAQSLQGRQPSRLPFVPRNERLQGVCG